MTDKDSAALGLESLKAFQDAKNDLLNSLAEVEATITRNLEAKEAIVAALGEIGVSAPPEKKAPQRRGKKAEAAVVEPVEPPEDPELETPDEPVVEHLPSGDTQDDIVADAEAKGEDGTAALEDWEPGEDANAKNSKSYAELNFDEIDEIQF